MQPVQFSFNTKTTFVTVNDVGLTQLAMNFDQRRLAAGCNRLIGVNHKGPSGRMTVEILQQFTGARNGDEVIVVQIACLRLKKLFEKVKCERDDVT